MFKPHIRKLKPRRRYECEELIKKHKNILHNKNWLKITVFVQNQNENSKTTQIYFKALCYKNENILITLQFYFFKL